MIPLRNPWIEIAKRRGLRVAVVQATLHVTSSTLQIAGVTATNAVEFVLAIDRQPGPLEHAVQMSVERRAVNDGKRVLGISRGQ